MNARLSFKHAAALGLFTMAGVMAGCHGDDADSPSQAAREALKIEGAAGGQRTVETRRNVDVIKETTVVDHKTGQVITTEKEVTPVTVEKTKEVETHVKAGETTKTVQ